MGQLQLLLLHPGALPGCPCCLCADLALQDASWRSGSPAVQRQCEMCALGAQPNAFGWAWQQRPQGGQASHISDNTFWRDAQQRV